MPWQMRLKGTEVRVTAVEIYQADLPLRVPVRHSSANEQVLEEVFLGLKTDSGHVSLVEMRGNAGYATGCDRAGIIGELQRRVAPSLIGLEVRDDAPDPRTVSAVAPVRMLVNVAVLDLLSKRQQIPLWKYLNGSASDGVHTHGQIGFETPADAAAVARDLIDKGCLRIKIRVGRTNSADDIAVLTRVREVVGEETTIALDANGGWTIDRAMTVVPMLAEFGIAWLEQPVEAKDIEGMKRVREHTSIPVIADEGVKNLEDLNRLLNADAIDGVHVKMEKAGTVGELGEIVATARQAGVRVLFGQMDQGRLGSSVTAQIASATDADAFEVWGFQNVLGDVVGGFELVDGKLPLPERAGIGLEVEWEKLSKIAEIK